MQVIGVIDLMSGRAVRARGGRRDAYAPLETAAGHTVDGNPLALARAYIGELGIRTLYVADLDAISGLPPQAGIVAALAALGPIWVDSGVTTAAQARTQLDDGAARVIVGLETLPSFATLEQICQATGSDRVIFSLDLRDGVPVLARGMSPATPCDLAQRAADAGATAIIVLDLARVGTGRGADVDAIAAVRRALPAVSLIAGGGVRGVEDLRRLEELGCDAALVATALHDGRLAAADVAARAQATVSR